MKRRIVPIFLLAALLAIASIGCSREFCSRCGTVVRTVTLRDVTFAFNKATLKPEAKHILDSNLGLIADDPTLDLSIEGHTDIVGSDVYNMKLSERRAQSVYNYLLSKGVAAKRMRTVGFGRTRPLVPNDTPANRSLNRRVEIKFIKARP